MESIFPYGIGGATSYMLLLPIRSGSKEHAPSSLLPGELSPSYIYKGSRERYWEYPVRAGRSAGNTGKLASDQR